MARKRYCPLAGRCGGCSYVNIDYRDELLSKYILEEKFLKSFCSVSPILPSDPYIGYRCKVQAVCGMDGPALVTGIYRRGSHKLIPVRDCLLEDPRASGILASVRTLARRFSLPAYDEDLDSGELRHVLIRIGAMTGEALVALVTAHGDFRGSHDFAAALHQRHPYIRSVVAIRNREKTSMVIPADAEQKVLYGSDHIIDEPYMGGIIHAYLLDIMRCRDIIHKRLIEKASWARDGSILHRPKRSLDLAAGITFPVFPRAVPGIMGAWEAEEYEEWICRAV